MQADDLFEKKVALDEHINFIREQLLYTDDPVETKRLLATLDDLLAEQMQLEDYLEKPSFVKETKQRLPALGAKPLGSIKVGMFVRNKDKGEWFLLSTKRSSHMIIIGEENNQTMYVNNNIYSQVWEYRE
ncbi:Hypothetical protein BQ3484_531 [Cedratvirus A11]|uniref:Uncharacterized protein n=1 Tax=Cedratvirus A11 TaxID=1903266 RepID=A0A1M7XV90_9VIRU|nr:Hypothetical protein BQ3484_531 [Cedratvirus A11]SHO33599.1 Hypothetical protein BQ3484_531 [Cedratvirus A11]